MNAGAEGTIPRWHHWGVAKPDELSIPGSGGGGGIGTAGAVLKIDNTNQRVGIGTTDPRGMLQVGTAITMNGTTTGGVSIGDEIYWVPGIRKSDSLIDYEKSRKSNIITASIEKSSIEDY